MRAVVTGASGMLGGAVMRELLANEVDVEGWSKNVPRSPDGLEFRCYDVTGNGRATIGVPPGTDLVVHCAARTSVEECEENYPEARSVNAFWSGELARSAQEVGARFIYVSTEGVYDGTRPGKHREDEPPNPRTRYAQTKLEGEGRVLVVNEEATVLRVSTFGWTIPGERPKLAETILGALTARRQISLPMDVWFSPLHAGQIAEIILELAANQYADGVINVGARNPVSQANFGRMLATVFGLNPALVRNYSDPTAARNVGLDASRMAILRGKPPETVLEGIERLYREAFDGTAPRIRGRETYP